jgi:D-arabinose 1-dehydrogenase-like Zn-dependent alcohol dehydrogenase
MSKMRVVQVTHPKGPLELVEREIPEPGVGSVRIKVEACGVCHGDSWTKDGTLPGISTRGCLDMRLPESSMRWGSASLDGL